MPTKYVRLEMQENGNLHIVLTNDGKWMCRLYITTQKNAQSDHEVAIKNAEKFKNDPIQGPHWMREAKKGLNRFKNDYDMLVELLEQQLSNGWTVLYPDEIGALTDDFNLILSHDVERESETDRFFGICTAYTWENGRYATDDYIEVLLRMGCLRFTPTVIEFPDEPPPMVDGTMMGAL